MAIHLHWQNRLAIQLAYEASFSKKGVLDPSACQTEYLHWIVKRWSIPACIQCFHKQCQRHPFSAGDTTMVLCYGLTLLRPPYLFFQRDCAALLLCASFHLCHRSIEQQYHW